MAAPRRPATGGQRRPTIAGRAPGSRRRADVLLVERGLAASRREAEAAVLAGEVFAGGRPVAKPGELIDPAVELLLEARRPRYVSRGGLKLEGALRRFDLSVAGAVVLDVGASTGGFTDCVLQHGAARVYAVDVGTGQLDWSLRTDPRVIALEQTHAVDLSAQHVPEPVDLAVVDVSFISLRRVLPAVAGRVRDGGVVLALVKPQFEAGRGRAPGGVVRSAPVHQQVLTDLIAWARAHGLVVTGVSPSPLQGPKGNREFFLLMRPGKERQDVPPAGSGEPVVDPLAQTVADAVREAHS